MLKTCKVKFVGAFTLLEVSIGLLIVGLLVGSTMMLTSQFEAAKFAQTNEKLDRIEEAIANYVRINGHLPCPVDPANNTSCYSGTTKTLASGPTNYYYTVPADQYKVNGGKVPTSMLGLNDSFAYDGFGNLFSYVVSYPLTQSFETVNFGIIKVYTQNGTAAINTITDKAAYVLFSHGPNGSNAFNISGNPNGSSSSATENTNKYSYVAGSWTGTFVISNQINQGAVSDGAGGTYQVVFDDIVRYKNKSNLVGEAGAVFANQYCADARSVVLSGDPDTICSENQTPGDLNCSVILGTLARKVLEKCLVQY